MQVAERKVDSITIEMQRISDMNENKAKTIDELKKVNLSLQQTILSSSERDAVPTDDPIVSCVVCLLAKPINQFAVATACGHVVCQVCQVQMSANKVSNSIFFFIFFFIFFLIFFLIFLIFF